MGIFWDPGFAGFNTYSTCIARLSLAPASRLLTCRAVPRPLAPLPFLCAGFLICDLYSSRMIFELGLGLRLSAGLAACGLT